MCPGHNSGFSRYRTKLSILEHYPFYVPWWLHAVFACSLRPAYTAHKFQRLPLIFCFWNKSPNCFVWEFQKLLQYMQAFTCMHMFVCISVLTLYKCVRVFYFAHVLSNIGSIYTLFMQNAHSCPHVSSNVSYCIFC